MSDVLPTRATSLRLSPAPNDVSPARTPGGAFAWSGTSFDGVVRNVFERKTVSAAVLFTFAGALLGIAITSGYSFWAARRLEQIKASVAAQTLDDEIQWLHDELSFAASARRPSGFDAATAIDVWRSQREALVLYMKADEFRLIGAALRACERWARATQGNRSAQLEPHEVQAAHDAMLELAKARALLSALAPYLWSEHEVFIGVSLWRGIRSLLGKKRDWTRPDLSTLKSASAQVGSDAPRSKNP